MQPIFKEQIKMWHDMGCDPNIIEGKYWLDNGLIKAFTTNGNLVKLYKYKVYNDLHIEITEHKDFTRSTKEVFETWEQTVNRLSDHLAEFESRSLTLLNSYENCGRRIVLTNSTGKDSMVMQFLAEKSCLNFKTYFNVTTMDVKESNLMAKRNNFEFTFPDLNKYGGFYQWSKREKLIPSRLNRACCQYFKERATMNAFPEDEKILLLFGMRNDESTARSGYTDIWVNDKWGNRDWIGLLPIREWSDVDIWLYIMKNKIEINPKYKMGYSRVGCGIVCPNYSKSTWVLDKYWYNVMYNRWREILKEDFISNNKWLIMNCTIDEYINICWNSGVYRAEPTEEVINEYAEHTGIDKTIAKKYFGQYCANGCINHRRKPQKIKDKDVLAMNMKMFGRDTTKFLCKKCLMKQFGWDKEKWNSMVEGFKAQGCTLF